jgi:uncharacterized membrane protein
MFRDDWQVRLIQLLAVPGILIAFYLLLFHDGVLVPGCSGSGWDDCGSVSGPDGQYSAIGPIPVALIGLLGYAIIFVLTWAKGLWQALDEVLPELLVGLTGVALLFSLGLTVLEVFVIKALCRYCVVSAILVVAVFALSVSFLRSTNRHIDD